MEQFIFIIGCDHYGTTLLNKIIGNHRDIYGIDYETNLFFYSESNILNELQLFINEKNKLNKKYICEKTPKHVYYIDKMYKYTINPKIIVITRDGRDVICSLKKRFGTISHGLQRWIDDNNQWLSHKNKNNFFIFKYEDLVKNKIDVIKKICKSVKIEYYDEIFNYDKKELKLSDDFFNGLINNNKHVVFRQFQINQDIYDDINRWKTELTKEELNTIYSNKEFISIMKKLDYEL
jgi:hypothetical protein